MPSSAAVPAAGSAHLDVDASASSGVGAAPDSISKSADLYVDASASCGVSASPDSASNTLRVDESTDIPDENGSDSSEDSEWDADAGDPVRRCLRTEAISVVHQRNHKPYNLHCKGCVVGKTRNKR